MGYIDKLKNHKKFKLEDIKEFVIEQVEILNLNQYVNDVKNDDIFLGIMAYSNEKKLMSINNDYDVDYKEFKKYCFKLNFFSTIACNNNDLYNLYLINTIFHEIWHAKQNQQMITNMYSSYSQLINISQELMLRSGTTYHSNHDIYFHESDAIINSVRLTLEFIKGFEFQEKALIILNQSFATQILGCYAKPYSEENEEYGFPVLSLKFLLRYLHINNEISNLIMKVNSYESEYKYTNDFDNLMVCNKISKELLDRLNNIKKGNIRTIDIFETLKLSKQVNKHM